VPTVALDVHRMAIGRQDAFHRLGDDHLVFNDQDPQAVILRAASQATPGALRAIVTASVRIDRRSTGSEGSPTTWP
jgi:hypothetical protein